MKSQIRSLQTAPVISNQRNYKKEELNERRFTEIEKANRILLERMTCIMHNKDRFPHSSTPQNAAPVTSGPIVLSRRSLNSEVRRKELMKITIEN